MSAYFFVHVMKTGGATLYERFSGNFGPGEVYPEPGIDPDMRKAYFRIDHLMGLPASRLARTRFFSGHFPLVAAEMLDVDLQVFSPEGAGLTDGVVASITRLSEPTRPAPSRRSTRIRSFTRLRSRITRPSSSH
jgi:hypothetical protein